MCAVGLDLPINTFTEMLYRGPDIFVPTGIDMSETSPDGDEQIQNMRYRSNIFINNLKDYAFLQIQGNPRYPGLNIWYNTGEKHQANYPEDTCFI